MKCDLNLRFFVYFCCAIVGLFLIIVDGSHIAMILSVTCGIAVIVFNVNNIYLKSKYNQKWKSEISSNIAWFAVALIIIFVRNSVVIALCGGILVIFSMFFILSANLKTVQIKLQFPRLLLGIIMLVTANTTLVNFLSNLFGFVLICICLWNLLKTK